MIPKSFLNWISSVAFVVLFISCGNKPLNEENRTLRMVYTDWSESVAITYLSAVLLEEEMEYQVTLKLTDVESAYEEVAEGDADVFADAWLPETHQQYMELHHEKIVTIGIIYPEARTGFVVPDYSRMQTVMDLSNYQRPIIGIDPGAGVMQKARQAMDKYSIPGPLLNLSEQEMIEHLEDSVKRRKEVVIAGWEPHWIFARYGIRFLEDPDHIFGKKESIYSVGHKGIANEHPHTVRFFERMQLTEKQLNDLVYRVRLSEDPKMGVKRWIEDHEYIVNQWVKNLRPERKKIM